MLGITEFQSKTVQQKSKIMSKWDGGIFLYGFVLGLFWASFGIFKCRGIFFFFYCPEIRGRI